MRCLERIRNAFAVQFLSWAIRHYLGDFAAIFLVGDLHLALLVSHFPACEMTNINGLFKKRRRNLDFGESLLLPGALERS